MNLSVIIIIAMLTVWIIQALVVALSVQSFTWKAGLNFIASACLVIGALGFFGSALSATGGLSWLPNTFEWPIGSAKNVLITSNGTHIAPHTASGRIQIYDKDLNFLRGWNIDASGGAFMLFPAGDNDFYIYVSRGNYKYHYDIYGKKLSSENYSPGDYSRFSGRGQKVKIPTPFYLLVFSYPFASWFVAAVGIGLLFIISKLKKEKTNKTNLANTQ